MKKLLSAVAVMTVVLVALFIMWLSRPPAAPVHRTPMMSERQVPELRRNPGPNTTPPPTLATTPPVAPQPQPAPAAQVSNRKPVDAKRLLDAIMGQVHEMKREGQAPRAGSIAGKLTGLREGEAGGVFAIKGDVKFANVTEDDLYDFGDMAACEAHVAGDGTFAMNELEDGHYTIIAFSMRSVGTADREYFFTQGSVDVQNGRQSTISLALR